MRLRLLIGGAAGLLTAFGGACSPESPEAELAGQVFLHGGPGDSRPLSLVRIRAYDGGEMERYLEDREEALRDEREALIRGEEAAHEALSEARAALEEQRELIARGERDAERERAETARRVRDRQERIRENEMLINELLEAPEVPEGIPTREEYQAFQQRREHWYSMTASERAAWREALEETNEELESDIEALSEREVREGEERAAALDGLRAGLEDYYAAVIEAEANLERAEVEREAFPSLAAVFRDLPEEIDQVRTDANGEFALRLPKNRRLALVALWRDGERERGWLLWIDPAEQEGRRVLLSDHNAMKPDDTWESLSGTNGTRVR